MAKTIGIEELYEKFKILAKDEIILDVRTADEYALGHVPGARNISHESVSLHLEELKNYSQVYMYCRSGGRVQFAAYELWNLGLRNIVGVVSGGMPDWVARGYPSDKS